MNVPLKKHSGFGGFTIMEVLFASLILTIIGVLSYSAMFGTFKTQKILDEKADLQETGTVVLNKIKDDITQTFFVESPQPKTQFLGEDQQNKDKITFTALAHFPTHPEARESDQTEITYKVEDNPKNPGMMLLLRRESPHYWKLQKDNDNTGYATLAENLIAFNIEYSDGEKFLPSWNIRSRDSLNKLPKLIRISLTLKDERGREEYFETVTDLPMSESLSIGGTTSGQFVQPGTGAAPGSRSGGG